MSSHLQNNFITFLFWTLVGSGLFLLLDRGQTPQQKSRGTIDFPAAYRPNQQARAQAILRLKPHTLGGTFISLN